jgi:hypothetical protein
MPDADGTQQVYDLEALNALAGVISGDLVRSYPKAMTTDEACVEAERDSAVPAERGEVVVAAWLLVAYDLAVPIGEDKWRSTLAAIKAEAVDF